MPNLRSPNEVPQGRKVTYANFVCDIRLHKKEPYRVRLVVGEDKLEYLDDSGSPAASLLETIFLINSIISSYKHEARFINLDLKDFFLASPMTIAEYIKNSTKICPR